MNIKFICISLVTLAVIQDINGKRTKKKRVNNEDIESTPQPNVVTYSTFGFKDVGSYDGFVPSSPDYANFPTNNNRDSSTRLYAPAFPSSIDSSGLGSYYDPQPDMASLTISSDGYEANVKPSQPISLNFFTSPNYDISGDKSKDTEAKEIFDLNSYNDNSPRYGTKLSLKGKNKNANNMNQTDYNIFNSVSSVIHGYTDFADTVSNNNNYPIHPSGTSENNKIVKISSSSDSTAAKLPKVVDFTSLKNYYPTSVESNKFTESMYKPYVLDIFNNGASDIHSNPYENNKYDIKGETVNNEKGMSDVHSFKNEDISDNYSNTYSKFKKNKLKNDDKDKIKNKQSHFNFNNNVNNNLGNTMKGYEYSTNYSNTNFKYDSGLSKRPFNSSIDEIVPAGSNLDFVDYQFPEKEYSPFKTSNIKSSYNFGSHNVFATPTKNKYKLSEEYLNTYKSPYTTLPTTTTQWGNIFKDTEFSSYKSHPKKLSYNDDDIDDIVHIPKRQTSVDYEKIFEDKPNNWGFTNTYKPFKDLNSRDQYEWTKDFNNRFKSEEDLLGLRNHDTSHPSYVPSFKPSYNNFDEDFDVKKLSEKWKQNFLKAKYRGSIREYDTFASEPKPVHVPLPKPYPIEVPHPVVVPVPQPYPVKVPIPKPVVVPIFRELTVPVEKPVPYPVIKKVPYPIEKLVPVPVVKQVPVPVLKPYPVHIPQIKPVFHHTKPHDDREWDPYEDDYLPRPEIKRPNNKRTKNSRNRPRPSPRRPSRTPYQDYNRRRVPSRRPSSYHDQRHRRPYASEVHSSHRYRDEFDDYDNDSDFERYCKRTGKC